MSAEIIPFQHQRQERMPDDKPSLSAGYCRVVNALAEGLAASSLTSLEHRVVWAVIRLTYGWQKGKDRIAASQLASVTGLTRQKCSSTLSGLIERGVIIREGGSQSAIKVNTKIDEWEQREKRTCPPENPKVNRKCKNGSVNPKTVHKDNPDTVHTKDKKDIYRKTTSYSSSPSENPSPQQKSNSDKPKPCPYQKIIDLYHEILPQLAEVQVLSEKRKRQIKARWQQRVGRNGQRRCDSLEFWERYFTYVSECPFLVGQGKPSGDRPVFFADLEWLTNATNFAKVIEGKYAPERGDS